MMQTRAFRSASRLACALLIGALSPAIPALAAEGDTAPNIAPFQWVSIGPTSIAPTGKDYDVTASTGRISSLALSPTRWPALVFAASANGGIWKRNLSYNAWSPVADAQPDLAFGAIAVAPSDGTVIYAGTGEDRPCVDCALGEDIYKSINGGGTWTTLTPLPGLGRFGVQTSSMAVDPQDPNKVWGWRNIGRVPQQRRRRKLVYNLCPRFFPACADH